MKFVRRFAKKSRLASKGFYYYLRDRRAFYAQYNQDREKAFLPGKSVPCLEDRFVSSGTASGHYFHQDLLVAQMVYQDRPKRHVDVGSRIDGFIAHVAAFREIDVFDIRPFESAAKNIRTFRKDIMSDDPELANCTDSLSCLHTLEHFGLGRYGDPVDYNGHLKGFASLSRMLTPEGRLYFSVPIGRDQRFEFNAHRIFSLPFLREMFAKHGFSVESFDYVDDRGKLRSNIDIRSDEAAQTFSLKYGCGIFALRKTQQLGDVKGATV